MCRLSNALALSCAFLIATAVCSSAGQQGSANPPRKQAQATRVAADAVHLDGRLDEPFWQSATPVTDFQQAEPNEFAEPTDRIDVRFVYDDNALWIGARMTSHNGIVQAPMSRRDDGDQAESLQIELDTFLDRRTAYMFGVTASGVRLDHFHPSDNEDDTDAEFDPVWRARTQIDSDGWTAELWLPFSQLRFNDAPERVWGLNIKRHRPDLNEDDYWIVKGRTASGWASRFGDLRGIQGVSPKARLEVLPYVSGGSRVSGDRNPENPFDDGKNLSGKVGADVKIGIGSNLTLDATINPDFGQVEADPAEVNLTVFETTFDEKRPFFIEGSNVLAAGTSNYYYSRRIGARPGGATNAPASAFVNYPEVSTILGAAKLTGRFKSGTSIGFLAAVTAKEDAEISNLGVRSDVEVAPRSEWGVARVIQQFGNQGSTIGAHLTMLHREMDATDPLASSLVRNAITTGVDTRIRFDRRRYEFAGNVGLTFLDGETGAIAAKQNASGHYLQRLDQPNIRFDGTRTSLQGAQIQGSLNKIAGAHWLWGGNLMIETPEFDPLDFGRLNYAGDITGGPRITYRETRPGKYLRAYSMQVGVNTYWYFDTGLGYRKTINSNNSMTLKNFWVASLNGSYFLRGNDAQQTRGGPSIGTPLGWSVTPTVRNSTGSKTRWTVSQNLKGNEFSEHSYETTVTISARPSPSLQFSIAPDYINETGTSGIFSGPISRQYLATVVNAGGNADTYNRRYVFGLADRTTFSSQFRVSYVFKPDMTLDVYAEPFAASIAYRGIGELPFTRSRDIRLYTNVLKQADGTYQVVDGGVAFKVSPGTASREQNVRSFRSNVVFKWEWRPGSTLFVVWQQNRAGADPNGDHVGVGDLFGSLSATGDNIFLVKTTLWRSR